MLHLVSFNFGELFFESDIKVVQKMLEFLYGHVAERFILAVLLTELFNDNKVSAALTPLTTVQHLSSEVPIKLLNCMGQAYLGTVKFFVSVKIVFNYLLQMVIIMDRLGDTFVELVIEFILLNRLLFKISLQVHFNSFPLSKVLVKVVF
jgi:hypothetical protein